jgi:hypothetical protein
MIVEMVAHLFAKSAEGSMMRMAGLVYDIRTWQPWAAAIGGLAVGGILWWPMWVHLDRSWDSARAVARQKGLVI